MQRALQRLLSVHSQAGVQGLPQLKQRLHPGAAVQGGCKAGAGRLPIIA